MLAVKPQLARRQGNKIACSVRLGRALEPLQAKSC